MKITWILSLCFSFLAYRPVAAASGGFSDGGGNAVVCRNIDSSIRSAELLDFYEGRIQYGLQILNQPGKPALQIAQEVALNMSNGSQGIDYSDVSTVVINNILYGAMYLHRSPKRDIISKFTKVTAENMRLLPSGTSLQPLPDSHHIIVPNGCAVEQLAVFKDKTEEVFVVGDIWDQLDNTNQAALLVHEALYKALRLKGETTSERTRLAVMRAFAGYSFESLISGVPKSPLLCWSERTTDYRFAVYPLGNQAIFQFFRLSGEVPLSKTILRTDIRSSPLYVSEPGSISGASADAKIEDIGIVKGERVYWEVASGVKGFESMNIGNGISSQPVSCKTEGDWGLPNDSKDSFVSFDFKAADRTLEAKPGNTKSCYGRDILGPYGAFEDFAIEWSDSESDFTLTTIEIKIDSFATSTIAGDELRSFNGTHGKWNGKIKRSKLGEKRRFTFACNPVIGSLVSGTADGTITVYGIAEGAHGEIKSAQASKKFNIVVP
jgi:hypothetical protein